MDLKKKNSSRLSFDGKGFAGRHRSIADIETYWHSVLHRYSILNISLNEPIMHTEFLTYVESFHLNVDYSVIVPSDVLIFFSETASFILTRD